MIVIEKKYKSEKSLGYFDKCVGRISRQKFIFGMIEPSI